jgi:hypothetical protein
VSSIPPEIPGIGAATQKVRVNPNFDAIAAGIGPQEYYVLSRIDGNTALREVLLATGLPADACIQIAQKLRSCGALLLPTEATPAKVAPVARPASPPTTSRPQLGSLPATFEDAATVRRPRPVDHPSAAANVPVRVADLDLSLPSPSAEETAALTEVVDVSEGDRRRILALARLVSKQDPWLLLGASKGSSDKELKRIYFRLSKEVHPDRYYGKNLGSFALRLSLVFEAVSRSYAELTTKKAAAVVAARSDTPQTPQEYAQELFDRACAAEVSGNATNAMKLFAAAVRMEPQLRYLRRAANCALLSEQPRTAVEYAKKATTIAPDDPSSARLLAQCFKALGQFEAAEEVLVMAMAIKSENDVLSTELRNDLVDVRRAMGR